MRRFLMIILIVVIFYIPCVSAEGFNITSKNVILYNLNDQNVLYDLEANERVPIASLTKIMTAIVAIEHIDDMDQQVTVMKDAFQGIEEYTQVGLKVGDVVTYRDLLYGTILSSGADAVNVMAINLSGDISSFVQLMNQKVDELGLKNTHFDNPVGMDSEDNYSTASDVATILLYSLKNDVFKEIFTTKNYIIPNLNLSLKSTLIGYSRSYGLDISDISGAKSGFTDGAGLCLASIANIDDVSYLLVTLGADTQNRSNAVSDSLKIYNYYSSNYSYQRVVKEGQVLERLPIKWGKKDNYDIVAVQDISLYLENNIYKNKIEYIYDGIEELTYRNKVGDKIGTIIVKYGDQELTKYDVYLKEKLEYYHPILYGIIFLSILLMLLSLRKILQRKKKRKLHKINHIKKQD